MAQIFYDRTNAAGGGSFFDRSNEANPAAGLASGSLTTATSSTPAATVTAYAVVTLVDPIDTGPGSIAYTSNFTGTPAAGDTVHYPTSNGFQVHEDGTVSALTNSGAYACFYTALDGSFTDEPFTVNLDGTAVTAGDIAGAVSVAPSGSAQGFVAGNASGAIPTATASSVAGAADSPVVAAGSIGTATSVAPAGNANAPSFIADARGSLVNVISIAPTGSAKGAANALGQLPTATVSGPDGTANEFGRADAFGAIPEASASPPGARARAQWGVIHSPGKIWNVVS